MSSDRWTAESQSPDWPRRVAQAITAMPAPRGVTIQSVDLGSGPHAGMVLVTYRREGAEGTAGLRVDPRKRPPVGGDENDLADALAGWLVAIEIGEPRGNRQDTTWTDPSGVVWRSYPSVTV